MVSSRVILVEKMRETVAHARSDSEVLGCACVYEEVRIRLRPWVLETEHPLFFEPIKVLDVLFAGVARPMPQHPHHHQGRAAGLARSQPGGA